VRFPNPHISSLFLPTPYSLLQHTFPSVNPSTASPLHLWFLTYTSAFPFPWAFSSRQVDLDHHLILAPTSSSCKQYIQYPSVMSMSYEDWQAAQANHQADAAQAAAEAEPQPFDNPVYEYTYVERRSGDPPAPQAGYAPQAHAQPAYAPQYYTAPPPVNVTPFHYQAPGAGGYYSFPQMPAYASAAQFTYPAQPAPLISAGVAAHVHANNHYMQPAQLPVYATQYAAAPAYVPAYVQPPAGTLPWYGRTRAEVEEDNQAMAYMHQKEMQEATEKFKPGANPHDQFWVWEPDHKTRNMYTFAAIDKFEGKWHMDPNSNVAYFIRKKKD
jgi:hypothetical protein